MAKLKKCCRILSVIDAAYISGLLDGEGTIYLYRSKPSKNRKTVEYKGSIAISNTDLDVLSWVQQVTGIGSINPLKQHYGGLKNMPKIPKQSYAWTYSGSGVADLLGQLLPYLEIKVERAEKILRFYENIQITHGGSPACVTIPNDEIKRRELAYQEFYN